MPIGAEPCFEGGFDVRCAGNVLRRQPEIEGAVVARAGTWRDVETADECRVGARGVRDPVSKARAAAELDLVPCDVGAVHAQVHAFGPRIGGAEGAGKMRAVGIDQREIFFRAVHVERDERECVEGFEGGDVEIIGDERGLEHGGSRGCGWGSALYTRNKKARID